MVTNFILISGNGNGAGKSFFAEQLHRLNPTSTKRVSLADGIRRELEIYYPQYDWFNKTQTYKETTVIKEAEGTPTMRELLVKTGQALCKKDKTFWCNRLLLAADFKHTLIIDDVRKVCELEFFKKQGKVLHFHVHSPYSVDEPQYQNDKLRELADYEIEAINRK